jgi:hypothetical protein
MRNTGLKSASMAFDRKITCGVNRAVSAGARTLPEILRHLPGVFPLAVAEKMKMLGLSLEGSQGQHPMIGPETNKCDLSVKPDFLLPHPLDYDWRFSQESLGTITNIIKKIKGKESGVFCFGCPSVSSYLRQQNWHGEVRLYDLNGSRHEEGGLSWSSYDYKAMSLANGVAVADPPWYQHQFKLFLWVMQQACAPGTDILLAVPPNGTRPGISAEMRELKKWCEKCGFIIISRQELVLPYVMPLFELNTLIAHGVRDAPLNWRRADLWHIQLVAKIEVKKPTHDKAIQTWEERQFGAVRVRFRTDQYSGESLKLHPLGNGGFLGSVSSRDPLRRLATVVTSGGRFFACDNANGLLGKDSQLIYNKDYSSPKNHHISDDWNLKKLITVEERESARYYDLVRKINTR